MKLIRTQPYMNLFIHYRVYGKGLIGGGGCQLCTSIRDLTFWSKNQ